MPNFTAGTSFTDGVTNDVTALKLNALIADAVPTSSLSLNSTTGTIATFNSTTGTITTGVIPTLTSTTLITTGTGTAAAPAIVPTGDTNTGIFFPAADTIAFSEGGAESMRIDSSGQVGIGIASPSGPLHIRGATGRYAFPATSGATQSNGLTLRLNDASDDNAILDIGGNSTSGYWLQATNNANLALNYPLLLNPNGGNVGIGTASPAAKLHIVKTISQTDIDTADQIINLVNTATDTSGNLSGIRLRQENGTNTANSFIGLSITGNSATRANLIIATPNTSGNSTERLRIDSSGNVGIGVTSPADTNNFGRSLDIRSSTGAAAYFRDSDDASKYSVTGFFGADSNAYLGSWGASTGAVIYTSGTERLRIDSSGNVGIGTTSPSKKFAVSSGGAQGIELSPNESGVNRIISYNRSTNLYTDLDIEGLSLRLKTNDGTERLRIDSNGDLLVGTTDSAFSTGVGVKFRASATAPIMGYVMNTAGLETSYNLYNTNATNNGYRFYVNSNGGISNFSANNVNLSDERLKTNINIAGNYLDKICSIPVKTFNYKDQGEDTEKTIGVLAQEVETQIPELVNNDGFGETPADGIPLKTIYQTDLQYVLMRCIQELKSENDSLKSRIEALEAA